MVPGEGFEPPAFGLQNRCTTTVLTRHDTLVFIRFRGLPRFEPPGHRGPGQGIYIVSFPKPTDREAWRRSWRMTMARKFAASSHVLDA